MTQPTLTPARPSTALAPLAALLAVVGLSAAASAQAQLDQSTLIDRLAEEGMTELLQHLVETDPPQDPVVAAQVEIANGMIRFGDTENLEPEERFAALDAALGAMRKLIAEHADHPQRPLWQTDLGELLLTRVLDERHNGAGEFYEFGVPTTDQRAAVESVVAEAFEQLAQADLRFAQLRTLLPREADYQEKYARTGLEQRLFEDYFEKRTQFYLAFAAHLTSLLPDSHAYFTDAVKLPGKRPAAGEEKARLSALAVERVAPFVADTADATGARTPSLNISGRALLRQNKNSEALAAFQQVIDGGAGGLLTLVAQLGSAVAQVQQGQFPAAITRLQDLQESPLLQDESGILYRLLVADAEHRARLAQAAKAPAAQAAARAAAYEPYVELLDDPALGEAGDALRNYVYTRWADTLDATADAGALPPVVRMALGEVTRVNGQNAALAAEQAGDEAARAAARETLKRSIELNRPLAEDANPAVKARAMYNLALATYFSDPQTLSNVLGATALFVKLADELPDQRQAEEAIQTAVGLLRELHMIEPRPSGADEAYRSAVRVLFEKYGTSEAADNERLYYGYFVLEPSGDYERTASVLADVPPGHPDYFTAQREMLLAMERLMEAAPEAQKADRRRALREAAERVRGEATNGDTPEARQAAAASEVVQAGAAIDESKTDDALRVLEGFEERYAGEDTMLRLARERRIIALADAQQLDRLAKTAREMMDADPDAAAYVIDQVLTDLAQGIDRLEQSAVAEQSPAKQRELRDQSAAKARTASALADMLVNWARDQGYSREEMLPYQLVLSRSRRMAGQATQALEITNDFVNEFGQNANVMHEHAENLYAEGSENNLAAAAGLYDRLITGLPAGERGYPREWWNAWMRRLQINDRMNQNVAEIPLRVRQLKLTDPELGGNPFKETLERLSEKHAR